MAEWYYQQMGEVVGPVPLEELKQKAQAGQVQPDTLVRQGAVGQWTAASEVEDLSSILQLSEKVAEGQPALGPEPAADSDEVPVAGGVAESDLSAEKQPAAPGAPGVSPVHFGEHGQDARATQRSPLALRPCLDCGQLVSGHADWCPHCGRLFRGPSSVVSYHGEHPVPVLTVFVVLAVVFLVASPMVVYAIASGLASRLVENEAAADAVALAATGLYVFSMVVCAILGRAVGAPRMARKTGLLLGLFFGPLGVFAAFAIDKRPLCFQCGTRLNGLARQCPNCRARMIWKTETAWY